MRHVPPPHLPAADLGLTDDELHALLWVTERLEDGRIGDDEFDMNVPCGTACCIGGHMARRIEDTSDDLIFPTLEAYRPRMIGQLFFPPIKTRWINGEPYPIEHPGWTAGPTTAARACRQFLQTGAVDWDAVIEGRA